MTLNLLLFLYAIAKVSLMCGFAFSIAAAIFAEFRIVGVGIEQVRGGQLAEENRDVPAMATSSPRNVRCA